MPIYEFRCPSCDNTQEYFQKTTDPAPGSCEACGKNGPLEKVVSQTSFQLKGGGWYSDLYSSPKKDSPSKPDSAKAEPKEKKSKDKEKAP